VTALDALRALRDRWWLLLAAALLWPRRPRLGAALFGLAAGAPP
jgi:hypothetical protein